MGRSGDTARIVGGVVAVVAIAIGTVAALQVGDPHWSGIVEESFGGAGTRAVVALFVVGIPAVVLGVLDGLATRIGSGAARAVLRVVLIGGLGAWAGLCVYLFAELDCDSSCTGTATAPVVWSAVVMLALLALETGIALLVGRAVTRKASP